MTTIFRNFFALCFTFCIVLETRAAVITSHFEHVSDQQWTLDLALKNDTDTLGIHEFTIYFPEFLFSDLTLLASPASWDSIVAQPDSFLNSPGFFDSYNLNGLALGKTQSGFRLSLTYLGLGEPEPLAFDIIDENFLPSASGFSHNVSAVPESSVLLMFSLGWVLIVFRRRASAIKSALGV